MCRANIIKASRRELKNTDVGPFRLIFLVFIVAFGHRADSAILLCF